MCTVSNFKSKFAFLFTLVLFASFGPNGLFGQGRIVASHDNNILSSSYSGTDQGQFVVSVSQFLTGANTGNILAIESTPGDPVRDYSTTVRNAWSNAGFNVTITDVTTQTLAQLQAFDAVFVTVTFPVSGTINSAALTSYVQGGGNVYIANGTGVLNTGAAGEGAFLNPFLTNFGLAYNTSGYNTLNATFPVTNSHPIFNNVNTLGHGFGASLINLNTNPDASIVQTISGENVFAVVEPQVANQVPTLSQWGIIILGLIVLSIGAIAIRNRQAGVVVG